MVFSIAPMSTFQAYEMRKDTMSRLNAELDQAAVELSTGRHADIFEAIGAKSSRAFDVGGQLTRTEGFLVSNRLLEGRLDATNQTLSEIRAIAEEFLTLAAASNGSKSVTTGELQAAALTAFERIAALSNTTYSGARLLSGVATDTPALTGWDETAGGSTPEATLAGVLGAGLVDGADADAKADALDAIFADDPGAPAGQAYSDVFYGGSAGDGVRLTAQIDSGSQLDYGVQADDQGFRDLMQGLAMFASLDVADIADDGAYTEWTNRAIEKVSEGVSGVLGLEVTIGGTQERLASTVLRQEDRRDILLAERGALEAVDPYDAAMRLSELEARLEASYAVTARLQSLSFLNYI